MKMRAFYYFISALVVFLFGNTAKALAQLPYTETFETDGSGTRYKGNFFTNTCSTDFFRRGTSSDCSGTNASFLGQSASPVNVQGSFFIGGDDVCKADAGQNENPLGAGENAYVVLKTLDVSSVGFINVEIAAAGQDNTSSFKETNDALLIQVAFDGNIGSGGNSVNGLPTAVNTGSYTTIGAFYGDGSTTGLGGSFVQDADLNGVADPGGAVLTHTFTDYTFGLPTGGASLMSVRVVIVSCDGSEDLGFDNIRVTGLANDPVLTVAATPATKNENASGNFTYTFSLDAPAGTNTTINFSVGGSASFSSDYSVSGASSFNSSTGSVVIPSGSSSATVTLNPTSDGSLEPDETIILTATSGPGYNLGSPIAQTVTIENDDAENSIPLVAITGLNHDAPDAFSFVVLDDITSSQTVYFTENTFDNNNLNFTDQSRAVMKWVSPAAVTRGHVFVVKETAANVFSLSCTAGSGCGTITKTGASGSFTLNQGGETFTAYADNNDNPTDLITKVHSTLYTPGGSIPASENPTVISSNAVLVQGFATVGGLGSALRTEYNPSLRNVTVDKANFQNISNWLEQASIQDLSTTPFSNIIISQGTAFPQVDVTVSPASIVESDANFMTYTFTLSENATTDYTINFTYSGSAIPGSDFTTSFLPVSGSSLTGGNGSITILSGTNTASLTVTPINDPSLEPDESFILTLASGTGYDAGPNNAAAGIIENNDKDFNFADIAIAGARHDGNDGLSFVALRNLNSSEVYYFTDNEYDKSTLAFDSQDEFVVKYTVPGGGLQRGQVVTFEETGVSTNVYTVTCSAGSNCGTAVKTAGSGSHTISPAGEIFYAYSDIDEDPTNGITRVHAILQTGTEVAGGGDIAPAQNAQLVYPNSILVDGFPAGGLFAEAGRTEYDPAKRNVPVEAVDFTNINNWLYNASDQSLSPVEFADIQLIPPDISIQGNGTNDIFNGATTTSASNGTDFGEQCVGSTTTNNYSIWNYGGTILELTGSPIVAISGPGVSSFTVTQPGNTIIAPEGSVNFSIQYSPTTAGNDTITVTILSTDVDEGNFTFIVTGSTSVPPTTATVGQDQEVCVNTTTLEGNTPTVGTGSWEFVQNPGSTGSITTISSPTSEFSGTGPNSYQLRWVISNGVCPVSADTVEITLNAVIASNTITADQPICEGSTPSTLDGATPTGGNGIDYAFLWQSSTTSASSGFATAAGTSNGEDYSPGSLTVQTWYRRIVTSGACSDTSNVISISIDEVPTTATAGQDQEICGNSTTLEGNTPTVGTGSWEFVQTPGSTGSITTALSPTSEFTGTGPNTYKLRWVISNGACPVSADTVEIILNAVIASNTITADQTICVGSTPSTLDGATPTGGNGIDYAFLWQSSTTSASSGFATAAGTSNGEDYSPGSLTTQTWYRRIVTSGACSDTSNVISISIDLSTPGVLTGADTVCSTTNSGTLTVNGFEGSVVRWEYSTDNFASDINSIANLTTSYFYSNLTQTTQYRAVTQNGVCPEVYSNTVEIKVDDPFVYTSVSPGYIDTYEFCEGQDSSLTLALTDPALLYQWQVNTGGGFTDLADDQVYSGTDSSTLRFLNTPVSLENNTYRCIISNICGVAISDTFEILVKDSVLITSQPVGQVTCPVNITYFTIEADGETISYRWEVNKGSGFELVSGPEYAGQYSDSLQILSTSLGMNGYLYRCIASNLCSADTSDAAILNVNQEVTILAQPIAKTVCEDNSISFVALAIHTQGQPLLYQWQRKAGNSWVDINTGGIYVVNDSILEILNAPYSLNGALFRCVINDYCQTIPKSLTVTPVAKVTSQPTDVEICVGNNASFSISASGLGLTYRWQVNTGAGFVNLIDNGAYQGATSPTLSLFSPTASIDGNQYRCIVSGTSSCDLQADTSAVATISISPSAEAQTVFWNSPISTDDGVTQAVAYVLAINKILQPDGKAEYRAGNSILLNPGFEAEAGAVFTAKIQNPCQNTSISSGGNKIPKEITK